MGRSRVMLVSSVALLFAMSCQFTPRREAPGGVGGMTGGGSGGSTDIPDGAVFRPDTAIEFIVNDADPDMSGPSVDANCGNEPFVVIAPPPDLLILLDRSGSMNENSMGMGCGNGGCGMNSKWYAVTTAINQVVAMTETTVNWGLKFFGNDNQCGVTDGAAVAPGPNNAMAIAAAIALRANQPGSGTPTREALLSAGRYMSTVPDMNKKFILLATDGQPTCAVGGGTGTADDMPAIDAMSTVAAMGFPTFVIGIATGATGEATLSALAVNGGQPRMGVTPPYYPVTTTADLVAALGAIQTVVMGMCTYPLGTPGANSDPTRITVTVDGETKGKDDPDGWAYDPGMTSITFTGTTCAGLMAGTLKTVQLLYGCKVGPVL